MMHLSSVELVDALDGTLSTTRRAHLESCGRCAQELAGLRAAVGEAESAGPLPEPSPLFWEHFTGRVRAAVGTEQSAPAVGAWWYGWRPLAALGTAVAAVILAVGLNRGAGVEVPVPPMSSGVETGLDPAVLQGIDEPWKLAAAAVSDLSAEQLDRVVTPEPGSADALLSDLSEGERAALARLVLAQMEGGG